MNIGKIPEPVLKRSVLKKLVTKREEVLKGPGFGEDCGILELESDELLFCSADSITATDIRNGYLAVHTCVNNLVAAQAEPVAVMLDILMKEGTKEAELKMLCDEIESACSQLQIQVLGGHTEVTDAVNRTIITVTGMGKAKKGKNALTNSLKPGMDLIVTKWIGMEGTALLASQKSEELKQKFPPDLVEQAEGFLDCLSVVEEAGVAKTHEGAAMHDAAEGGIFGALWEMAERSGVGLEISLKKIPVRQETIEICEYFGLNPYVLLSGGALLIGVRDGQEMTAALQRKGIPAVVIGRTTDDKDRVLVNGEDRRFLERPKPDELYRALKEER